MAVKDYQTEGNVPQVNDFHSLIVLTFSEFRSRWPFALTAWGHLSLQPINRQIIKCLLSVDSIISEQGQGFFHSWHYHFQIRSFYSLSILSLLNRVPSFHSRCLWPHCNMAVQEVGQMVRHQILARHSQIDWVPKLELSTKLLQSVSWDVSLGQWCIIVEDVVPDCRCQLFRPKSEDKPMK